MIQSSKLLEKAVAEISKLPGIGRKTALRLALFMLQKRKEDVLTLSQAIADLVNEINYCKSCKNISDTDLCGICADPRRSDEFLCIVEDIRDVLAIENTSQFKGKYHVLGGIISPMDGIGPADLNFSGLKEKIQEKNILEVLLALPGSSEGETTSFYIYRLLKDLPVKVTTIARGIAVGDELEYADEITLARSIQNRILYENALKN